MPPYNERLKLFHLQTLKSRLYQQSLVILYKVIHKFITIDSWHINRSSRNNGKNLCSTNKNIAPPFLFFASHTHSLERTCTQKHLYSLSKFRKFVLTISIDKTSGILHLSIVFSYFPLSNSFFIMKHFYLFISHLFSLSSAHSRFLARGGTVPARLHVPVRACGGLCAAIHGLLACRRWYRCRAP